MKQLMVLIACSGVLLTAQSVFGQGGVPSDPNNREPEYVGRMRANREYWDRINRGMIANRDWKPRIVPRKYPDGKPYTKEEIAKIEALKKPNEADSAKYADFLKQSKTGLFRLFPFLPCEEKNLIRVDGECADFVPNSWAYSFRLKNYADPMFFDLKFKDGNLTSGSELSLGVLTSLGDVPIENISLASDGIKFLAELKPETEQLEVEKQVKEFVQGTESGGYKYSKNIKVEANTTYGLRVIAYRMPGKVKVVFTSDGKPENSSSRFSFPLNTYDERDDITLAFRVIRKDEDGNITIIWKELRRTDAPKLVFPKDVKSVFIERNPK